MKQTPHKKEGIYCTRGGSWPFRILGFLDGGDRVRTEYVVSGMLRTYHVSHIVEIGGPDHHPSVCPVCNDLEKEHSIDYRPYGGECSCHRGQPCWNCENSVMTCDGCGWSVNNILEILEDYGLVASEFEPKPKEKKMANELYKFEKDGVEIFCRVLTEDGQGRKVVETIGKNSDVLAVPADQLIEVIPYTIGMTPLNKDLNTPFHVQVREGSVKIGDLVMMRNGIVFRVDALDTKRKGSNKLLGWVLIAQEISE